MYNFPELDETEYLREELLYNDIELTTVDLRYENILPIINTELEIIEFCVFQPERNFSDPIYRNNPHSFSFA